MDGNTPGRQWFRRWNARLFAFLFIVFAAKPSLVEAQDTGEIVPGKVFAAVQNLTKDLESLRVFMGAPVPNRLYIEVREAAPHDVYFQALTLFKKANRLSFEVVRVQIDPPSTQAGVQIPANVLEVVRAADAALQLVLVRFELPGHAQEQSSVPGKSPSDVFELIRRANRQLNTMLERRFSPSDVYMQVTFAVGYASNLLSPFSEAARIPDQPPLVPGKTPGDVFNELIECLANISKTYAASEFQTLQVNVSKVNPNDITPSDVFDIASLVVARLDFLRRQLPDIKEPLPPFYPGRKFPSDVYQRVGLLKMQLKELAALTRSARASP